MRLKALTLGYVLNTHIMGVESLENFLRALKGQGVTFFFGSVESADQNPEIFRSEKIEF